MFRNYLIIAFRNLSRQKLYATINILGLAIGLTAAILIFLWVRHELSYDKYHQHSDRIFRLVQTQHYSTGPLTTTCMPEPIGRDFKELYPEVADVFMFYNINAVISAGDDQYNNDVFLADPSVFKMLDFNFLYGEADQVFDEPGSIVITDETAEKLFGRTDVRGEVLKLNNEHSFKITAVIEKIPDNSSVDFDYCIPFEFIEEMGFTTGEYGWNTFYCYVELYPETNLIDFQKKIRGHIEEKNSSEGDHIDLFLFPFEKIHLYSVRGDAGAIQYVYIFSAIAFFILLIAGINFMNLSTARSSRRSREIGIRKTFGATRGRLIGQFIGESFIVTLIATIFSILLVYLLLPSFNTFTDKQIGLDWADPVFLLGLTGMVVFVGFLAGSLSCTFPLAF